MEIERNHTQFRNIKTDRQNESPDIEQFPEEMIEEILLRLPVKSLLRFRCVAKSWHSLIGSKGFIKTHLEKSAKNTNLTHHRVILNAGASNPRLRHCSLTSLLNESETHSVAFDNPMYKPNDLILIAGCCNGLICILINRKYFILWNPSTRISKRLPDIDNKMKHGDVTRFGFGFDESNGDYKVFAILSVFWFNGRFQGTSHVYSLKTNSWNRLNQKNSGYFSYFSDAGKFVSGKLHWGKKIFSGLNSEWNIVSFNLTNEVYGTVEQPNYEVLCCTRSVEVLGGCLCVLCEHDHGYSDIWVLKQYGVKDSWSKVVSVPYYWDPSRGPFSSPICIGPNGEILLMYGPSIVMYDPGHNQFQRPTIPDFGVIIEVDVYVESLVSLLPDGEQEG